MGYTTYQLVDFPTIGNMIRNCEEIGICDCIIFYIPMDGEHVHRNYVIFFYYSFTRNSREHDSYYRNISTIGKLGYQNSNRELWNHCNVDGIGDTLVSHKHTIFWVWCPRSNVARECVLKLIRGWTPDRCSLFEVECKTLPFRFEMEGRELRNMMPALKIMMWSFLTMVTEFVSTSNCAVPTELTKKTEWPGALRNSKGKSVYVMII